MENKKPFLTVNEIQERIPHRFPFLLVDRVLSFEYGERPEKLLGRKIVAVKNVSINEQFFIGHFPDNPVMPGVLQVEAMAQAGALACVPEVNGKVDVLIAKISEAKFRKPVTPGDVLELHAEIVREKSSILTVSCKAYVNSQVVAEAQVMAKIFRK